MNTTRKGKIARLPLAVREELNRRLDNGESGTSLRAWLHALPEVQAVLRAEFDGREINAQNLTEWRQGGYREWQATEEARALAEQLGRETLSGADKKHKDLPEMLALSLGARYFVASRFLYETTTDKEEWRLLCQFNEEIMKLRRSDLEARRLELQRRRMELDAKKIEMKKSSVDQAISKQIKPFKNSTAVPDEKARVRKDIDNASNGDH
jgi:hypothetical protein